MHLLDTNILIYYLDGKEEVRNFIENKNAPVFVSVISVTELLAKPTLKKRELLMLEKFFLNF